ncbi:hypothetical protein TIFTF001_019834 [Ficus carica]|uniref:Uncharacterized protein n=1 Tax=Ficus carica TaxID=3494 RepID=A0AA88A7C9_FICCA|nr:hypothetical protein TIFTF001_019834 [Ficus carica]
MPWIATRLETRSVERCQHRDSWKITVLELRASDPRRDFPLDCASTARSSEIVTLDLGRDLLCPPPDCASTATIAGTPDRAELAPAPRRS